jgi:Ca-activated chloride channel family protein
MVFKDIWILLFIPLVIALGYIINKRREPASIRFSSGQLLKSSKATWKVILAKNLFYLRLAAIVLFIIALARPRTPLEESRVETEGIDIVLTVDCSGSMLAEDFTIAGKRYNRLAVVKDVVKDFIQARKNDRIGIVAFAARAYTVCPLTLDYDWLLQNLERVEIGTIEDGTAVGSALSSSLNRLRDTKAKSKIIILLTDGVNNTGKIAPLTAAEAAKALGIKVYTIGAGSKGLVPYPVQDFWGRKAYQNVEINIDEDTLSKIAQETNAKYFRATDTESLTKFEEKGFQEYKELFYLFLITGLILLILEVILSNTILRRLP